MLNRADMPIDSKAVLIPDDPIVNQPTEPNEESPLRIVIEGQHYQMIMFNSMRMILA